MARIADYWNGDSVSGVVIEGNGVYLNDVKQYVSKFGSNPEVLTATMDSSTVAAGGVLYVSSGGTCTNLTVNEDGSLYMQVAPNTVVQGTSNGVAFNNSNGYLSGYTHDPGSALARIAVMSNGTATDITCNFGWINVNVGGLLTSSYITSTGGLTLSGGDAVGVSMESGAKFFLTIAEGTDLDITSGGSRILAADGVLDGMKADGVNSTWIYVITGGSAINTVGSNRTWLAVSNGYASNTILRATATGTNGARVDLRSGGVVENTSIFYGGSMSISNNRSIASNTYIHQGGIVNMVSTTAAEGSDAHMYAKDTYVFSGGTMMIKGNAVVTGEFRIEEGAKVSLTGSAATLDFDVTNRTADDAALYSSYSLISGAANAKHTITVLKEQDVVTYRLADGVAAMSASFTVSNEFDEALGTLTVGGDTFVSDGKTFSLTLDEGSLLLGVKGMVIDGKYTVSAGETIDHATLTPSGMLTVSAGGSATNLTVQNGASLYMAVSPETVVTGTSNGVAFSNRDGYLSGYTHNPGSAAARVAVMSGGTATDLVCSSGWINVNVGGLLTSSYITSTGGLTLSGGDAIGVSMESGAKFFLTIAEGTDLDITSGGSRILAADGVLDGMKADGVNSTWIYVITGGSAINTVGNNKTWLAVSNGYASNTILSATATGTNGARIDLRSGGVVENTSIFYGGSMSISNNRSIASNTFIHQGGIVNMVSTTAAEGSDAHMYAKDTYVFSGGTMMIKGNAVVTGEFHIEEGAKVSLTGSAATLDFDVTNRTAADNALYSSYSLISGAANAKHTITVSSDQSTGAYQLAAGAADFAATVTVKTATEALGTLSANGDKLIVGSKGYALTLAGDALALNVSEIASGLIIDGTFRQSAGMPDLVSATVAAGGYLQVYSGGVATDVTVQDGASLYMVVAPNTIVTGTSNGVAFSNSNGYLSGYTHDPENGLARIILQSGGTATAITCNESWINVSSGSLLSNSYITSNGKLGLNGGDAVGVTLEAGATLMLTINDSTDLDITSAGNNIVASNGVLSGFKADGVGSMFITNNGGSAVDVTGSNYFWMGVSSGYTSNVELGATFSGFDGARMDVRSGSLVEDTVISYGGSMAVYNNGTVASGTQIYDGGVMNLVSTTAAEGSGAHMYAKDTYVHSGGTMLIRNTAVVTGELQIEEGANVSLTGSAATLDFDVTNRTSSDAALYNNYSLISGAANAIHTVTVAGDQALGTYSLADGAGDFAAEVALIIDGADSGLSFTIDGATATDSVICGKRIYRLADNDSSLTLSIANRARGDIDGNGISDILFQNLTDSLNPLGAWMDADMWRWNGALGPAPKDEWTVYGAYDFTGDGVCDIMFRSKLASTEYAVGYYDMGNDGKFETMGWGVTAEWDLAQVGDFNGNGVADILWRNSENGYHGLWLDGTNEWAALPSSYLSPEQRIFGAGDVNGDGCDEILIDSNGTLGAWDISGVLAGTADAPVWSEFGICLTSDWNTVGAADFDGNGKADIVVWNGDSGLVGAYMNCDLNQWAGIFPSASPNEWAIPGFGDYDGDGCDDILVRNLETGALGCWSGSDNFNWKPIGYGVDSSWGVIA